MTISEMVDVAYSDAKDKGFWDRWYLPTSDKIVFSDKDLKEEFSKDEIKRLQAEKNDFLATRLALIHSEVSEALEALRKGDMENFAEELADIVIRVADTAGGLDIDLEGEIIKKMEKNKKRGYKHGKRF